MYLPGWPLFMAPFARAGIAWLASPVCFGALIVAVARLGRRAGGDAAGRIAAVTAMCGACTLLNAGSRYCHVFVAACFAWGVEAICATRRDTPRRSQWHWGFLLGTTTSLALCTRPQDGGLLFLGPFVYLTYALLRRRIGLHLVAAAIGPFITICGLTLIILRLQLGEWFKTGYSIAPLFFWWTKAVYDVPAMDAWKYGLPFMTASYSFFPIAPAFAVAGLLILGRRLSFMFTVGIVGHLAFYTAAAFGRYGDFGYGPRYYLVLIVPMAIGAGVLLAPLWNEYRARRIAPVLASQDGPALLAACAVLLGVARIAPLMYPFAHDQLHIRSALTRAIERDGIHHAVVTVRQGDTGGGPLLDAQNDPFDPAQDVIVLSPDDLSCSRELYRDRKFYWATGQEEVTLTPY
jgi:hypothetical protein